MSNYNHEHLNRLLEGLFAEQVYYASREIRYPARYSFYQKAVDFLFGNSIQGDYYEFGCHKAVTFRMCLIEAAKSGIGNMNFYAFDSFEGLPEIMGLDKGDVFQQGNLCTAVEDFRNKVNELDLFRDKIHIFKGFYDAVLTAELQKEMKAKSKASLINVDCDLYESTVPVLKFIEPLLQEGTIIIFDDYFTFKGNPNKGEQRAFAEFAELSNFQFVPFLNIGWFGKSFIAIPKSHYKV